MKTRFFDPQNTFWHWLGKLPDIFVLSLLWLLCCIPIVTAVPASIALYDAVARNLRPDEKGMLRRFFSTLRKELGRGILMSLLWAALTAALYGGYSVVSSQAESGGTAAVYALVYQVSLLIPIAVFNWLIPLESRFVYTLPQLHKNAFLFTFLHLPQTAVLLILDALAVAAMYYVPVLFCIMPALLALLQSVAIEKVFAAYMPEE